MNNLEILKQLKKLYKLNYKIKFEYIYNNICNNNIIINWLKIIINWLFIFQGLFKKLLNKIFNF